jgi:NTP pyrophosphatase (non-canonical NTP hydrolase)
MEGCTLPLELGKLQAEAKVWTDHNFPNAQPFEPLLGISEEVGELHHAWLKKFQGIRGTKSEHDSNMGDALGDIIIYMLHFANIEGFDLEFEVGKAWDIVRQRDWKANPTTGVASGLPLTKIGAGEPAP